VLRRRQVIQNLLCNKLASSFREKRFDEPRMLPSPWLGKTDGLDRPMRRDRLLKKVCPFAKEHLLCLPIGWLVKSPKLLHPRVLNARQNLIIG
jgi:hypothetical protein